MARAFDAIIDLVDTTIRVYMRLRSRVSRPTIRATRFGFRMHCDTRDFIQRRVHYFGIYEPNLTYYILQHIWPGDYVLDVGANVGYVTLLMASAVGATGNVVAIEASPRTYERLLRNLALNGTGNVVTLNVAATLAPCTVEIVKGEKNNSGTNRIRPASGTGTLTVQGNALANLVEIDRGKVTFIKIDVEGSEGPILEHILQTLAAFESLHTIVVELASHSASYVARFLAAGFRAYGLPNNYRIGYLLVRDYLRRSHEDGYVIRIPVNAYEPRFRDFVFERAGGQSGPVAIATSPAPL